VTWWEEINHFKPHEFDSGSPEGPDVPNSGRDNMDENFVRLLDDLREWYGKSLYVSSGYRTHQYNIFIRATQTHETGKAGDILVSGADAMDVLHKALELGFTGIGLSQKGPHNKRFIHLDTLDRVALWTY